MSKFFKKFGKKASLKTQATEPRSTEEIQKAYGEELARAGQNQYLVHVYGRELEQANQRLLSLNQEAAARQELEAKAKAETQTEGVANEQS